MGSTDLFYSNCGCLHSETSTTMEEFPLNFPQGVQVNNHSCSQTNLKKVSNADSLKTIFLSKESIHVVKLNTLRKRMLMSLNGIRDLIEDQPLPDGEEDLKRRQQRAVEFSSRFGRNYLYPLQRQMNIIAKFWKNLQRKHTYSAFFTLCQKVIAAHQNAQSALQAYLHHIPSSVEKGIPGKLQELLQVVHDLCCICSMLGMSEEELDFSSQRVKQQCQMLTMEIQRRTGDENKRTSCTALSLTCSQKDVALNSKKESTTQRFSMYSKSTCLKSHRHHNRKKATKIPVTSNKSSKVHSDKQKLRETATSCDLKKNQLAKSPVRKTLEKNVEDDHEIGEGWANDDVKTMMEFIISEEVPTQCSVSSKRINSDKSVSFQKELERINSQIFDSSIQKEIERTDSKLCTHQKNLNKKLLTTPSTSSLRKLEYEIKNLKKQARHLKEIGHSNYPIYLKALEVMSWQLSVLKERLCHSNKYSCSDVSNTSLHFHKSKQMESTKEMRSSLSEPGCPKNVKLICISRISDNESFHERDLLQNVIENDIVDSTLQEDMCLKSVECQANRNKKNYSQRDKMNKKPLDAGSEEYVKLTLSQSEVLSALEHQQAFQEHIYSSSLYNESLKPWLMVERLANNLMDNVLQEIIVNDTGIPKITSGLLNLEFQ